MATDQPGPATLRDALRAQLAAPPETDANRRRRRSQQAYLTQHPEARHWFAPRPPAGALVYEDPSRHDDGTIR